MSWQRGWVSCFLLLIPRNTDPSFSSPIPSPLRKLIRHAGSEAPWWGRVCTASLLCLVLHITSSGIDIPQPFLSPSPPPSLLSSGAAPACSLFRGSKKSSRRSKNSSVPALPRLGAACLLACLPQHLNTNKIPHHPWNQVLRCSPPPKDLMPAWALQAGENCWSPVLWKKNMITKPYLLKKP